MPHTRRLTRGRLALGSSVAVALVAGVLGIVTGAGAVATIAVTVSVLALAVAIDARRTAQRNAAAIVRLRRTVGKPSPTPTPSPPQAHPATITRVDTLEQRVVELIDTIELIVLDAAPTQRSNP